jgi:hypothetical protein
MTNTEHYFPDTAPTDGDRFRRHGKSVEARTITRNLQKLIGLRVKHRRKPPSTTRAQDAFDLRYATMHREIRKQIDSASNTSVEPARITGAQRALYLSVLRHKQPLSKSERLVDLLGADEILEVRDGDISEIDGQQYRARVKYVPVRPDSFWDPETGWIQPPKLDG